MSFPDWSLQFHCIRLSSCLSVSGEPDLKSCCFGDWCHVTSKMPFINSLCYCPKIFLCRLLAHNYSTSPNCHMYMHTDRKPGFSVRDRLHNGNSTHVFQMGNVHSYILNLLRIIWICNWFLTSPWHGLQVECCGLDSCCHYIHGGQSSLEVSYLRCFTPVV